MQNIRLLDWAVGMRGQNAHVPNIFTMQMLMNPERGVLRQR